MHNSCTIFCLTRAKVLLPPLTCSSPSPKVPCLEEAENLQQLLVFLQQKTVEENAYIKELKKYYFSYSRCVIVCMMYMSACEQCCRLCTNSIPFKVCIMRSSEVPLILCLMASVTTLRKRYVDIAILRAETRLAICDHPKINCL